jgi:hypothetical protein
VVTSFLELAGIDDRKTFCGLIESYDEIVEHDCRVPISATFQSGREATSVMEDINVKLEWVQIRVGFDALCQARGRLVSAFLSFYDQRGKKDCPIAIDQHHHSFFTSLDSLKGGGGGGGTVSITASSYTRSMCSEKT